MFLFAIILFGFHGIIENDTTWSDTAHLTGDVLVTEGVTLTIDPGTVVLYADSSEWDTAWSGESNWKYFKGIDNWIDVVVEGDLRAIGDVEDSIYIPGEGKPGYLILVGGVDSLGYLSTSIEGGGRYDPACYYSLYNTQIAVFNCFFSCRSRFFSEKITLNMLDCEFVGVDYGPIGLREGKAQFRNCSFQNSRDLGWHYIGVYEAVVGVEDLDSLVFEDCSIEGAYGVTWEDWRDMTYGIGISASGCVVVEINSSEFKNIRGGNGGTQTGVSHSGADGFGVKLVDCSHVSISENQISSISGGAGGGSAEDGQGYGIYLWGVNEVVIDNNSLVNISAIGPGSISGSLICCNSNPLITNNEFNSVGRYIYIDPTSYPRIGGGPGIGNRFLGLDENTNYVIYNDSPFDIVATWNYWEPFPPDIDSLIFDYYDDPTKGIVYYDHATDVDEESNQSPQIITLESNLVKDVLNISLAEHLINGAHLEIFDASGRRVLSMSISSSKIEVDVSAFPRGVYFVSVNTPEEPCITRKVILN